MNYYHGPCLEVYSSYLQKPAKGSTNVTNSVTKSIYGALFSR